MVNQKMLLLGAKETFLTRVLIKKVQDAGIATEFITWSVNEINSRWEDTSLITLYMDEGDRPPEDVIHFLNDRAGEHDVQMIVIGEKEDTHYVTDRIAGDLIYKVFVRPVDNTEYVKNVSEFYEKIDAGEFKKSILIVDDDPSYMGLVREWLKGTYKVSMANSGLQAIKWLGKNKVDLILLDHEMPVTSGPQVLEMLRSDSETKDIPVMFLTGKSDKESVMAVVELRPEGYFLKSIQKDELLEKLQEFFILHK